MTDTSQYTREGWVSAVAHDIKEGDHVRWSGTLRVRRMSPPQHIGIVTGVEVLNNVVWLTIRGLYSTTTLLGVVPESHSVEVYVSLTEALRGRS